MPPAGPKSRYVRHEKSLPRHNNPSSAQSIIKAPFVPAAPKERPGWKGVGFQKPKKKNPPRPVTAPKSTSSVLQGKSSEQSQQKLLTVVRQQFASFLDKDYEEVKGILEAVRIGMEIADTEDKSAEHWKELQTREAYIARWAPVRGLIFAAVLDELESHELLGQEEQSKAIAKVVACGGAVSELLGWALFQHSLATTGKLTSLLLVDGAPWDTEIETVKSGLGSPPQLSKYASAAARAAAVPFLAPERLTTVFEQRNILSNWSTDEIKATLGTEASLITLFFTLKDLQRQSLPKTAKFLLSLAESAPQGSLLLVVDDLEPEAGAENEGARKYPLKFMLDLALLGRGIEKEKEDSDAESEAENDDPWERITSISEKWTFEPPASLKYPLGLGKVGLQTLLFRKR